MAERPEACPEWREALAAWAVAQSLPAEEDALLEHLHTCAACQGEADGLLAVAAVVLAVEPDPSVAGAPVPSSSLLEQVEPPADLRERIADRIASERRGRLVRRMAVAAAGAAAAAAVVVGAVLVVTDDGPGRLDGEQFALAVGQGEAIIAPYEGGSSEVQLVARGLDPDTTYALWLSVPGGGRDERVPAGTFRPDEDGDVDVRLPCSMPADEVGRVWATSPQGELVLDTESA